MKHLILILAILSLTACGSSGGGGSSDSPATASIKGQDFSGTYMLRNLQCYDKTLTTLTNSANFQGTVTSYTDQIVVVGNSFTETFGANGCSVVDTGSIVVSSSGISVSNVNVTSPTSGSCTVTYSLNNPKISPSSNSQTYSSGQVLPSFTNASYVWQASTKSLGLLSTFTDGTGGYCFMVYSQQ